MLKILQARPEQCTARELPSVQAAFRRGRGTQDQTANIRRIIKKAKEFQKDLYFCFIEYTKIFDCINHDKLWAARTKNGCPTSSHPYIEELIC